MLCSFKLLTYVTPIDNCSSSEQAFAKTSDTSDFNQLDGKIYLNSDDSSSSPPVHIPVYISDFINISEKDIRLPPARKTLRRNNLFLQSMELPTVMNLNPRSIYNKSEDLRLILDQYFVDCVTMSESWEREDLSLISELLDLEYYKVISNVKQREFKGGKPAIIINTEKYNVKPLCPDVITVPVGVEAVWALILKHENRHFYKS